MIRCLIVDDEPLAQRVLEKHIEQTAGLSLAGKCFSAGEAFTWLHEHSADLLFLDIRMPGVSGIQFIRSLKEPPAFIFTTAFAEHAITGYDLEAVDYLLKPITYERFQRAIQRFLQQQAPSAPLSVNDYLYIKTDGNLVKLLHQEMVYMQAMKDYIKVVTDKGIYLTHMTMKSLQELLPTPQFARIHRSFMVNTQKINVIGRDEVTIADKTLPVGENYKMNLKSIDNSTRR